MYTLYVTVWIKNFIIKKISDKIKIKEVFKNFECKFEIYKLFSVQRFYYLIFDRFSNITISFYMAFYRSYQRNQGGGFQFKISWLDRD